MSAINKEKIYTELRNYHVQQLADHAGSKQFSRLREEFVLMEEKIISMVLSLANGKTEFTDSSKELNTFSTKLSAITDKIDDVTKDLFAAKIKQLSDIMSLAKESNFRLKPVRGGVKV